jgi:hypothetical protein
VFEIGLNICKCLKYYIYPNFPPISRGLSEENSKNIKKIVTAAYTEGAAKGAN